MSRRLLALTMLAATVILMAAIISCGERTEEPPKTGWRMPLKAGTGRIEVNLTFDVPQGTPLQTYLGWVGNLAAKIINAPGCLSCFVSCNIIDCPEVKLTAWWQDFETWSAFTSSAVWREIRPELNSVYATDMNAEFWRVLPVSRTEKTEEPPVTGDKSALPVEVNFTINLEPHISRARYRTWVGNVLDATAQAPGKVMSFASVNIWDSPEVQWTSWWTDLGAWTKFTESTIWQALSYQLHAEYANSVNIDIWELETRIKMVKPPWAQTTDTKIAPMPKTEDPGKTGP